MKARVLISLSSLALVCLILLLSLSLFSTKDVFSIFSKSKINSESNHQNDSIQDNNNISPDTSNTHAIEDTLDDKIIKEKINSSNQHPNHLNAWIVLNNNEEPISTARVRAVEISEEIASNWIESDDDPDPYYFETVTDSNGVFEFSNFHNKRYVLWSEKESYYSEFVLLDLTENRPTNFQIYVHTSRSIEGRVINGKGDPISDAEILAYPYFMENLEELPLEKIVEVCLFYKESTTNKNGHFKVEPFSQRESINLHVLSESYLESHRVINFTDRQSPTIVLKKPCTLKGKVKDKNNIPIANANIKYRYPSGNRLDHSNEIKVSDEKGFFSFEDAPEGEIHIYATHDKYGNSSIKHNISQDSNSEAIIRMTSGFDVTLFFKNSDNKPINKLKCYVDDLTTGCFLGTFHTDNQGRGIIDNTNSNHRIRLITFDLENVQYPQTTFNFEVQDDSDIELTLQKSSTLRFEVYDKETKNPIKDYSVARWGSGVDSFYENMGLNSIFECKFDSHVIELNVGEGEFFQMELLAEGYQPHHLEFYHDSNRKDVEVIPVYLERGASLSGFVVNQITRDPIPDAHVSLYINGNINKKPCFSLKKYRSAITDSSGYFRIDGLFSDGYSVKVEHYNHSSKVIDSYDLVDKQNCTISLNPGCTLQGHVYGQEGLPMESAQIRVLLPGSNDAISTFSYSDGSYYLSGIPAGTRKVSAKNMQSYLTNVDYSSIVKTITFQPGGSIVHDFHFSGDCTINGICSIESVPTKGIGINVLDAENKELLYQTDSLFDGFYMIPNLASGDYIIEAYCGTQGCGGSAVEIISLSTEESKSLDFNLTRESLNGKISDTMNNPLSFSDIELIPVEGERTYSTTANRDGSYKFVNVKEGEYYIAVRADEYAEENRGPMLLGGSYPSKTENFHLSEGLLLLIIRVLLFKVLKLFHQKT